MAYTYTGTPNQRIEQARRRISNDQSVELNPTLLAYQQAYEQQIQEQQAESEKSKANVGKRLLDTFGDVGKSITSGLIKAGEGLVDFGASTVGIFAGLAGDKNLKDEMTEFTARDLTEEMWDSGRQNGLNVDLEDSYIYDMSETGQNIVRGVGQGVGQMLPMLAVTVATAGAGGAAAAAGKISAAAAQGIAKAGQVANLVGLGMSAAGSSTEQALNTEIVDANGNVTNPTLDRAYLRGLASGAMEMATEKLVGGLVDFTGAGVADKLVSAVSKSAKFSKAVEVGFNIVGEGIEEMVSEAFEKTLDTIYNSPDGKMHWVDPDIEDVFVSGVVGSLTAAVMGGMETGVRRMSNVQTAQDAYLDYENVQKKADNLSRQGKLDAKTVDQLNIESNKSLNQIANRYQRASEKGRQKMLNSVPALTELLNLDEGTIRKTALSEGAVEITSEQASKAMSGSLAVTRRAEIANALKSQNLTLASNLDATQQTNMKTLEKALALTGKKSGATTKVVVAEHMADNAHLDGDIMYISKDRLSSAETVAQDFAHEAFHFSENTEEYRKMIDFFGTIKINGESLINTAIDKVRNLGYDVDDSIFDAIKNRESVSGKDAVQVELAFSEINAKAAELLFGDAETVEKLVNRDRSLARKVLSNIRDYAKIIESTFKGDSASVETLKQMRQGIKLFEDALASSGENYLRQKAVDRLSIQNSNRNEFNTLAMQWAYSDKTQVGERTIRYRKDNAVIIEKTENGYIEIASPKNKDYKDIWSEINEHNDQIRNQSVYESAESYEFERRNGSRNNVADGRRDGQSGRDGRVYQEQSGRNGNGTYQQGIGNQSEIKHSLREVLSKEQSAALKKRGIAGDDFLNAQDLAQEILSVNGVITADAKAVLYHATTKANAESIEKSGKMYGKEPAIYFSTKKDGVILDYGDTVVETKIPLEKLHINDVFNDEIHLTMDVRPYTPTNIRYSLRENATDSEGRTLSSKQIEYFKDTKVVDKNGNLLVMYHGTFEDFTVFDIEKTSDTNKHGKGHYFTSSLKDAETHYTRVGENQAVRNDVDAKVENMAYDIFAERGYDYEDSLTNDSEIQAVLNECFKEAESYYSNKNAKLMSVFLNVKNPLYVQKGSDVGSIYEYVYTDKSGKIVNIDSSEAYKRGYDGIIDATVSESLNNVDKDTAHVIVFQPEQIKLADNPNPTTNPDIRYSLRDKQTFGDKKTKAELLKRIEGMQLDFYGQYFAANIDATEYFATDALGDTLANQIVLMANDSSESNRYKYASDLAEHIIDNMTITNVDPTVLSELTRDADLIRYYRRKLDLSGIMDEVKSRYGSKAQAIRLQWGVNKNTTKVSIEDAIGELRSEGVSIESDISADAFFEMLDIVEKANKQTQKTLYKTVREALSEEEFTYLQEEIRDDILSFMDEKGTQQEWNRYFGNMKKDARQYIAEVEQRATEQAKLKVLEAEINAEKAKHSYDNKIKAMEQELQERTQKLQAEAADAIEYNAERHKLIDKCWSEAVSLSADNLKKYNNSSDLMNQEFVSVIKKLNGIKYRGELKKGSARKIIADFGNWYNINNPLLTMGLDAESINRMMSDDSVSTIGYLDKFTLQAIETIKENLMVESKGGKTKGQLITNNNPLTTNELRLVQAILASARHALKNYNTVQIRNKNLSLSQAATTANEQAQAIAPHNKKRTRIGENASSLIKSIIDPITLISEQFGYQDNSPLVDAFKDIQDGATHAAYVTNQFTDLIENFVKDNKNYRKHLADKVKVGDHEIRVDVALSLYMLSQQSDSINGLKNGGWGYRDSKGYWIDCGLLTDSDIKSLEGQFTKADEAFIKTVRKFFNETGKALAETDMNYKGYTLINTDENSHYFPIVRYSGDMAKSVADAEASKNISSVSVANYSFTKERVKNERRITVVPILDVINKHAREVGNYVGMAIPIKEFTRLYNANIGGEGKTMSIRNTINEQSWNGFDEYITTLLKDIQGVGRGNGGLANKALNLVTSHIATNALGFNLKTILSQISGYPAIYMNISLESMTKAFAHSTWYKGDNATNMLKYSEWAAVKAHDNGLILAETGAQKLGKVANFTTLGIQTMDNAMNRLIWNACQCEIEKRTGLKFGTVENMIEAGKLHSEVGRATQGNNARSELSAMQRSNNALAKMYSMFNSDGFKYMSRFYEAIKRVSAYKYLNKVNPGTISQQKVRSAHTFMAKAATAVIASNLVYCLMGQLMKFALNKDREDKDGNEIGFWQDLGMDFLGSMVGMIPVIRDIYSLVVEGYEVKDNATEGIMSLAEAIKDVIESTVKVAEGDAYDSTDIAKPLKSLVDAVGLCTGLPTRNVYNYLYGFTKRFSPSAAYEWNSVFYNNSYTTDLKKAIEKDDVDLQKTIVGLMLKDDGMTDTSEIVNERLRELYKLGYTVLPKSVKDTLTYNGETYNLSKRQQNSFKAIYGKANDDVEELVASRSFSTLSAEIQAKAIKWIYDYYYECAVYDTIGEEADSKKQLFGEVMSIAKFAMTISACQAIESKLDKKGNVIAGSKKQAILQLLKSLRLSSNEQLMVLAYLGYSVADDEKTVKNFVSRIGLTKSQQKTLLQYCGLVA